MELCFLTLLLEPGWVVWLGDDAEKKCWYVLAPTAWGAVVLPVRLSGTDGVSLWRPVLDVSSRWRPSILRVKNLGTWQ
eukprot:4632146-Amphidinium_carterae.1